MKTEQTLNLKAKGNLLFNEPLSRHTTFKIGGPANIYFEPETINDLRNAINFVKDEKMPFCMIGQGSNILASDSGFGGMVISLNSDFFKKTTLDGSLVKAGGGCALSKLLDFSIKNSLSGLEFLAGIPGTVGGGIIMNAGTKNNWIGSFVEELSVMDDSGKLFKIPKVNLEFGYRKSNLSKYIIVEATILLKKGDGQKSISISHDFLREKLLTQELSIPSAGCVFKNPPEKSAGRLIEQSGLKGRSVNDAVISEKHANFIINKGKAKAEDVLSLIKIVRERIKKDYGILLELEIKLL